MQFSAASRRVLFVDDDPRHMEGTALEFGQLGYEPIQAQNLDQARKILSETSIDFLILDWWLPDSPYVSPRRETGGEALLKELTSGQLGSKNKDIPFLIVSLHDTRVDIDEIAELAGFQGVRSKLDNGDLHERVTEYFGES